MSERARKQNLESAISAEYGKNCTVHKQTITRGGHTNTVIVWICGNGNDVILEECYKNNDTDCVTVKYGETSKIFYQGNWEEGDPGDLEDYHGFNAYFEAEKYAMEQI